MRVLVTGATGFLGGALCRFLRDQGFVVVATGRSLRCCAKLAENGFEVHPIDLAGHVHPTMFGQLDAIVHAAALSAPFGPLKAFLSANVDATRNIVAVAEHLNVVRFVNISSPSIYFALQDQNDVKETNPLPVPFNHYARTKAEAERIALCSREIGTISLRPRGIYGTGDTTLLPRLLKSAQSHPLPLFRGGRGKIDLTHISDVCRAILAALNAPQKVTGQVFNISGGEVLPTKQIIDMACARARIQPRWRSFPIGPAIATAKALEHLHTLWPGSKGEPRVTPYALALLAFEQSLNIDKASRLLNWHPQIRFREGLEEAFGAENRSFV